VSLASSLWVLPFTITFHTIPFHVYTYIYFHRLTPFWPEVALPLALHDRTCHIWSVLVALPFHGQSCRTWKRFSASTTLLYPILLAKSNDNSLQNIQLSLLPLSRCFGGGRRTSLAIVCSTLWCPNPLYPDGARIYSVNPEIKIKVVKHIFCAYRECCRSGNVTDLIQEVRTSNNSWITCYRDFSWFFSVFLYRRKYVILNGHSPLPPPLRPLTCNFSSCSHLIWCL
jgi:hypothetical protein